MEYPQSFLQLNQTVLPPSFNNYGSFSSNQSLTTNESTNINCSFERNFINFNNAYSGGYNAGLGISQSHFFIRNNISGGAIQLQTGNDIRFVINVGNGTFIGNLIVSGALQSPSINLLGVSNVNLNQQVGLLGVSNVSTGTSIVNLNQQVGLLGVSNVSTGISTVNINQQIELLGVSNVSTGTSFNNLYQQINLLVGVSNQSGAVITLGISSSNMDRHIGLLGVSNGNLNQQVGILGVSTSRFLQRNELVLPSSFNSATIGTLNTTDNILIKSTGGNSYLYFNTNTSTAVNLVGMVVSNLTIRNSTFLFQTAGANNRLTIDSSGLVLLLEI